MKLRDYWPEILLTLIILTLGFASYCFIYWLGYETGVIY